MPANHDPPGVEHAPAVVDDRGERRPRNRLRREDADHRLLPIEPSGVEWRRVPLDARQHDVTADRSSSHAGANRRLAFENRQIEVQRRRKGRRIGVRHEDARDGQRRRRGGEPDLLRIRIAGDEHRTGPVLGQDRLRPGVPGDRGRRSTGDEEPVPAVEDADDAKRSPERAAGCHAQEPRQARQRRADAEANLDPMTVLQSHPAADAIDLTSRVRVLGDCQQRPGAPAAVKSARSRPGRTRRRPRQTSTCRRIVRGAGRRPAPIVAPASSSRRAPAAPGSESAAITIRRARRRETFTDGRQDGRVVQRSGAGAILSKAVCGPSISSPGSTGLACSGSSPASRRHAPVDEPGVEHHPPEGQVPREQRVAAAAIVCRRSRAHSHAPAKNAGNAPNTWPVSTPSP